MKSIIRGWNEEEERRKEKMWIKGKDTVRERKKEERRKEIKEHLNKEEDKRMEIRKGLK